MKIIFVCLVLGLLHSGLAGCPFSHVKPSSIDLQLASRTQQTGRVGGHNPSSISVAINNYAKRSGWPMKSCSEFTNEELKDLIRVLFCHHSKELQIIYESVSGHDGRARRFATLQQYEDSWIQEEALAKTVDSIDALRDSKCADALMHWTHHVPKEAKSSLIDLNIHKIPTLPTYQSGKHNVEAFNCVTGHNMTAGVASDHQWPHWPAEAHYHGTGHGAYPFWAGPKGQGGHGPIEVWYSETKSSEKYYHESCYLSEVGWKDVSCYHLFVGGQPNPQSYLYSATEDFCCLSNPQIGHLNPPNERLAAPQSNFMDAMTATGTITLKTETFNGQAKNYLLELPGSEPVTYFWYVTDLDGKPVQQGEGGKSPTQDVGRGIMIWHNYNTSSFEAVALDASIFAVPKICQTTRNTCTFP